MKETKVTEWIYRSRTDKLDKKQHIAIKLPKDIVLAKGNYLIKIYRLESET